MTEERRDSHDGMVSLLAGIGVGVLIGGMVALLLAPQAGEQTRVQLRESADDTLNRLRDSMDDLREKVEEMTTAARGAVASRLGSTADTLDDAARSLEGRPLEDGNTASG